jgi:hypothetical protein
MPRRPSKRPNADPVVAAYDAVNNLTGRTPAEIRSAVARLLGLLGGSKGGKQRAKNLTPKQRSAIAKKGAAARWKNRNKD